MAVIQLDAEMTALKRLNRLTLEEDGVVLLFRQTNFPSIALSIVYRSNLTCQEISKRLGIQLFWSYSTTRGTKMSYDLKITGGTIVDGTGSARFSGDLGIKDQKIVAMGNAPAEADKTIDATGRIVAPGFVDIHTHYDAQVLWDPLVSCSPWHGVTTIVMGNCGFSVAPTRPEHRDLIMRTLENVEGMSVEALRSGLGDWGFETFPEYLDALDSNGCAVNMAAMIGHTALRMYVMGEEATEREATDAEIALQRRLVTEALEAGALGFATSRANTHVG